MLDVAVAYNRYRFLGDEFLTWLWFIIETQQDEIRNLDQDPILLEIGNRMALENRRSNAVETITIKGDDAGLEEGLMALKKGALITELNLVFRIAEQKWQFSIKGESLNISGLKTPETARPETKEEVEGFVLEKIYLYDKLIQFFDILFKRFVHQRTSDRWDSEVIPRIRNWISTAA
jgi:hypothetical protein